MRSLTVRIAARAAAGSVFLAGLTLGITPASAFLDDTPDTPEETAPALPGVKPVIPLNKDDPTYNL